MSILNVDVKYKVGNFKGNYCFNISNQVTGIWGASGHGKTTLIQLISGLLKPAEGYIAINGKDVVNTHNNLFLPPHKRNIGVVFQEHRLFPHLSISKNLKYGIPANTAHKIKFEDVVRVLEIEHILGQMPSECSGGEKQRIALGRALLSQPEMLLLDEPFSALDKAIKQKAIGFIRKVIRKFTIPVIIVSHDISDILMLSNKMLLIKKGKVEVEGEFTNLLMNGFFDGHQFNHSFVNDLSFTVIESKDEAHYKVKLQGTNHIYYLYTETKQMRIDDEIEAFLRPEDITISKQRIEGISMQNQLEAFITDIYIQGNFAYCLLDVGTKLVAQITKDSVEKMALKKGETVYALFKSVALSMYDDALQMSLTS